MNKISRPTPEDLTIMEQKLKKLESLRDTARIIQGITKLALADRMDASQIIEAMAAEVDILTDSMQQLIEEVAYLVQKYKENPPSIH